MSTDMIWQVRSTDSADTVRLGETLGKLLKPPAVLELTSDLGGGKTTFTRGLVRGLGSNDRVASPTFTLNRIYRAKDLEIHHFDFYRLSDPGVVSDQLEESLQNRRVITVVEWSDIVRGVLLDERLIIKFKPVANDSNERLIEITYPETLTDLIDELQTNFEVIKP
jgi:tRNA threonylcarbamoyladenosine biosynthesis protein TsaE